MVEEDKPLRLHYSCTRAHSEGRFDEINLPIYACSDQNNTGAPKYHDNEFVAEVVTVTADLSRIPTGRIPLIKGVDQKMYYKIKVQIQVTYFSAYTTYELIHDGVNYGQVKAEYV